VPFKFATPTGEIIMSKTVAITAQNFHKVMAGQVSAFGRFRERWQDLSLFAMVQASGPSEKAKSGRNDNMTYVNALINAKITGTDRRAMQAYFEDHCDLQLITEDKVYKFKSKKTKGFEYAEPTKTWWEYAPTAEPKAIDEQMAVISLLRRLSTALKGKSEKAFIEKGHKDATKAIVAHLAKTPGLDAAKVKAALAA
jgi:hypothetical protein